MSLSPSNLNLSQTPLFQHYAEAILAGDRPKCRELIEKAAECGVSPRQLLLELCWPAMEAVRQLYKDHRISHASLHLATRLNRAVVDRVTGNLAIDRSNGKKAVVLCGGAEPEELGGQITADLFESGGYEVKFLGGGVPNDEVLHLLGQWRPDLLVMFATLPIDMPASRQLIDYLRDVARQPNLQTMCCGGIYARAEGLAEEVGADLYAADAADAVRVARENPFKRATVDQQTVGRTRRVRAAAQKAVRTGPRPVMESTGDCEEMLDQSETPELRRAA